MNNDQMTSTKEQEAPKKVEIDDVRKFILIAVYGTLRHGRGNWKAYLEHRAELLGTYRTEPKFTMFTTGGFPIVTTYGDTSIEYEVFKVDSNYTLDRVHRLEGCTGIPGDSRNWYDIMPIETPHGTAYMYVQHDYQGMPDHIIKSGNWNMRHGEQNI